MYVEVFLRAVFIKIDTLPKIENSIENVLLQILGNILSYLKSNNGNFLYFLLKLTIFVYVKAFTRTVFVKFNTVPDTLNLILSFLPHTLSYMF